jgi:hypothetical protein
VSVEGNEKSPSPKNLAVVETVRCLECGAVYSKPSKGGTVRANPGCPECGYLGWLSTSIPFSEDAPRRRSSADPPRRHSA